MLYLAVDLDAVDPRGSEERVHLLKHLAYPRASNVSGFGIPAGCFARRQTKRSDAQSFGANGFELMVWIEERQCLWNPLRRS